MDFAQLQAFDQVVRHGSFSKTARILDIAQPTVSARIAALEQAVGGALFVRGGTRLELTDLGLSFLPYARQALAVISKGIEVARDSAQGKRGQIMVGTLPTLAAGFFAATLSRLRTENPDLGLVVHTGHNQQIVEMLHDGFVKLGLMTWPFFQPDLTVLAHTREPLVVVAHPAHPLCNRRQLSVEALVTESQPFMQVDWSVESKLWQTAAVSGMGVDFEVPPQTAYDLVTRGFGTALLTRTLVAADLAAGRLVELQVDGLPSLAREGVLVCLKRTQPLSPQLSRFVEAFRAEAAACQVLHK